MTQSEARDVIQSHFATAWGIPAAPLSDVAWDNVAFDPSTRDDDWVRFSVQFVSGDIASLGASGARRFRRFGIVFVQVFTKADKGLVDGDALARAASNAFEGTSLTDNLWFRNVGIADVGAEGKWYQQNVSAEFQFDEIK